MPRTILILILGGLLMTASDLKGQTNDDENPATTTEESDPVVEALERQKKIAELEKAIAEAEKAKLAAKLPTTEGSGVTGSVTFGEGSGYFAEMLAYQAMIEVAEQVAADVGSPATADEKILLVTGDGLAKSAQLWEIANARVEDANERLRWLLDHSYPPDFEFAEAEGVTAAFTTAAAILGAAADIASFFRSDLAVTARSVNVTTDAMLAEVSAGLNDEGWRPILPGSSLDKTVLLGKIETLLTSRRELAERRRALEGKVHPVLVKLAQAGIELEAAKADLAKAKAAKPPVAAEIAEAEKRVRELQQKIVPFGTIKARWERVAAEIDATLAATDVLVKALLEGAEGKPSAVEAVAAADIAKSNPTIKILRLETSSQGGEMHVSKSAWRTRLTYVGGVAVSYLLLDHTGAVSKSGVVARPIARSMKASEAAGGLTVVGRRVTPAP